MRLTHALNQLSNVRENIDNSVLNTIKVNGKDKLRTLLVNVLGNEADNIANITRVRIVNTQP